jgi:hypothetical protein
MKSQKKSLHPSPPRIPKGFRPKAQGWSPGPTLGTTAPRLSPTTTWLRLPEFDSNLRKSENAAQKICYAPNLMPNIMSSRLSALTMKSTRFVIPLSIVLLAVAGYVFFYGCQKIKISGSTVGDDAIMIGYGLTAITTFLSALAVFAVRSGSCSTRSLPIAALILSATSFAFWAFLHLSGIVVAYSSIRK